MFEIYWEPLSKITFSEEMYFILRKWNQKGVDVFAFLVQENLNRLSVNPFIGKPIKSYYKLVISKQTTLFYKIIENKKQIDLLVFWNNLKSPGDLAKFL